MPRRAAPGNRARIEGELPPLLHAALNQMRELLDVRDWTLTALGPPFCAAAVVTLAADLVRDGAAPHTALETAAIRLGLEPDTVRTWVRRWATASRGVHNEHTVRAPTAVDLIRDAASLPESRAAS